MALKSTEESSAATGRVYYESLILRAVWYFSADVTNLMFLIFTFNKHNRHVPSLSAHSLCFFFLNVEQFVLLLVSGDFFPLAFSNCQTYERPMAK